MINRKAERWTGRLGVILAITGSLIGLGSFLRFPTLIAHYGGAFMIPYLCALLLLGLPLVWIEWALGRYGGIWGHHNLAGIYGAVTRRSWGKYLGVLALYVPFIIVVYYLYIESWTLGYTFISAINKFSPDPSYGELTATFNTYLGIGQHTHSVSTIALVFLAITLLLNGYFVYHGKSAAIDKFTAMVMPMLFILAIALVVRVLTLHSSGASIWAGLDYAWKPDIKSLVNPDLWLAATGQALFTLSLGLGAVITYASYLRKDDDVALSGLTSVSFNALAEIIIAGTLVVPVAIMLFGNVETAVSANRAYALGFITFPKLFSLLPYGNLVGAFWFLLLFFTGLTASVSLLQPIMAFFQNELQWSRRRSLLVLAIMTILYLAPVVLLHKYGFLDEMDFWAVNVFLVIGALVEVIIFTRVLGMARGWEGITTAARIRVPGIFKVIMQFVTPVYLIVVLAAWFWKSALPKLMMTTTYDQVTIGLISQRQWQKILTITVSSRITMAVILLATLLLIHYAWLRHQQKQQMQVLLTREESSDVP